MASPPKIEMANGGYTSTTDYQYMFTREKAPTKQLDALLRAIAQYIICEIGDKNETELTPNKLAAFYKVVGGDYDALFVDTPHESISYVWQVTGCQHSLLPNGNDYAAPNLPSLTVRGFSRWESLEILLGPDEHVPFLQYAVKNWNLKHPDSGEIFSYNLPRYVFPPHADADVDRWHEYCAERLRKEASKGDGSNSSAAAAAAAAAAAGVGGGGSNDDPKEPRFTFAHVRSPFAKSSSGLRERNSIDHDLTPRSVPFTHVAAPRVGGVRLKSPDRIKRDSPAVESARRKSFTSEHRSRAEAAPDYVPYSPAYVETPPARGPGRRYSHPRHHSPEVEEGETSEDEVYEYRPQRRAQAESPVGRHHVPPSAPQPPSAVNTPALRSHRSDMREEDRKHSRVGSSPRGSLRTKLTETVSNVLPLSSKADRERDREHRDRERPRLDSRRDSYESGMARTRRSREPIQPARLVPTYSDESDETSEVSESESSEEEKLPPRRRRPSEREQQQAPRAHYRDAIPRRGSDRSDRGGEEEAIPAATSVHDSGGGRRRDRTHRRQLAHSRTSSRGDEERRIPHPEWDPRDREREIGREPGLPPLQPRDRGRDGRKKWDRRAEDDRGPSPGVVAGRRYAETPYS